MASPPAAAINGLRDFFARSEKDKLSADLKRALTLLQLDGLDALEERFLATDAFLKPWAVFRDSIMLLRPDAMPRPTLVKNKASETGMSRSDVLYFYTQFDEGTLRYDSRADRYSLEYTPDSTMYGVIDKSSWSIEAYEKHLYAWLLQEFKIGKKRNTWGFKYFELQSAGKAWETVFVPIANAVRASYDIKGRRFYGRLALFVESRCPSRLAFPENNVGVTKSELLSPSPFRVVSMPKKQPTGSDRAAFAKRLNGPGMLTKKHYDETEKELRHVYPQYGGLVERPKFKIKMEEWLAEQRVRADARKALEKVGEVRSFQPQIVQHEIERSESHKGWQNEQPQQEPSRDEGTSPIKRAFDSIRRSVSNTVMKRGSKELPKSPLHGVTRQLHFPDDPPSLSKPEHEAQPSLGRERSTSLDSSNTVLVTPWPRSEMTRNPSYSSIRDSNPFSEELPNRTKTQSPRKSREEDVEFEPTSEPGTILRLMEEEKHFAAVAAKRSLPEPFLRQQKSFGDVRLPSYEGNGYANEISLTKLHASRKEAARTPKPTRLPVPIKPTAYGGPLRVVHHESASKPAPKTVPWPGFEDDDVFRPAVPMKSQEPLSSQLRQVSKSQPEQEVGPGSRNVTRIVSKANIRAAIGDVSREGSTEDLPLPAPMPYAAGPARALSPGGSKLHTYNTHLFPRKERKDNSLGTVAAGSGSRYEAGGQYEMEVLKKKSEKEECGKA
ncbi:hypothetical protein NX059_000682 [Plenodomus lindquistii]|nr:hypothetical protein NX059_000682 [Plenodomus lindquistii]